MELSISRYSSAMSQGETMEQYLDSMFGYYDKELKEEVKGVGAPLTDGRYRSTFEAILAKFGLELADLSFEEIISGDYYCVLRSRGLIDPINNANFESLGGVV